MIESCSNVLNNIPKLLSKKRQLNLDNKNNSREEASFHSDNEKKVKENQGEEKDENDKEEEKDENDKENAKDKNYKDKEEKVFPQIDIKALKYNRIIIQRGLDIFSI